MVEFGIGIGLSVGLIEIALKQLSCDICGGKLTTYKTSCCNKRVCSACYKGTQQEEFISDEGREMVKYSCPHCDHILVVHKNLLGSLGINKNDFR